MHRIFYYSFISIFRYNYICLYVYIYACVVYVYGTVISLAINKLVGLYGILNYILYLFYDYFFALVK